MRIQAGGNYENQYQLPGGKGVTLHAILKYLSFTKDVTNCPLTDDSHDDYSYTINTKG